VTTVKVGLDHWRRWYQRLELAQSLFGGSLTFPLGAYHSSELQYLFFEDGLSRDPAVRRWQQRSEPLFRSAFEGSHVTVTFHLSSARAASISNTWRQGTSLLFQSRVRITGEAWRFQIENDSLGILHRAP
jgi:hypothetical protein